MRREHHPFWLQQALASAAQRWAEHFIVPQLDAVGAEPRFSGMRFMRFQGPRIRVGDHFHAFATREQPLSFAVNPYDGGAGEGEIVFGDCCVVSPGARIRSATSIRIGDDVMLAERCLITDADWHDVHHRIFPGKKAPVRIGNNAWLGDSVTVCKGVSIGENSVIGAGSIVTRDVPANTISAGNPARVIGEIDPSIDSSKRSELFRGPVPYADFKDRYDRERLEGNSLRGLLRALLYPDRDS